MFKIEKIEYKKRKGRLPSSVEYDLGTEINSGLDIGDSVFIQSSGEIKPQNIFIRLQRLNSEKEYSILKEISEGKKGYRVYRIK